jgi:hypothetical protein
MHVRQIHALGEVLSEQAVGVFVGSPLPGIHGISEVDLDVGVQGEALVIRHLFATVPGE